MRDCPTDEDFIDRLFRVIAIAIDGGDPLPLEGELGDIAAMDRQAEISIGRGCILNQFRGMENRYVLVEMEEEKVVALSFRLI